MSEQFLVSARKYRPQTFETVVGQHHITETLKNAIRTEQIAHAYLFCGPRGVGKTTCARILAKTINCTNITADTEACGECSSCKAFNENSSFNIFELDAASNNSVEGIRSLTDQVRYPPNESKYKIYIIDEVHMLSSAAFNAFLKTLEEPPSYAIFILATTEKHKILPTILSRCQIFDFKRIKNQDIANHLQNITIKENTQAEPSALHLIARVSEGCMRDALSIMDRVASAGSGTISYEAAIDQLNILDADTYFQFINSFATKNHAQALIEFDQLLQRGFEGNVLLEGLLDHIRTLILCKNAQTAQLLDISEIYRAKFYQYAQRISEDYLISLLNIIHDCHHQYNFAANKRLHVEITLIKCCHLVDLVSINQFPSEEIDSKKKLTDSTDFVQNTNEITSEIPSKEVNDDTIPDSNTFSQNPVSEIKINQSKDTSIQPTTPTKNEAPLPKSTADSSNLKIGKSLLDSLIQKNKSEIISKKEIINLDEDLLFDTIKEYIQKLEDNGHDLIRNHVKSAEFSLEDEAHILCTCFQNLQFSSLNKLKQDIVDLFIQKTNNPHIKMNVILSLKEEVIITKDIMTKNELFDELKLRYPLLKELIDTAKLTPSTKYDLKPSKPE